MIFATTERKYHVPVIENLMNEMKTCVNVFALFVENMIFDKEIIELLSQ